MKRDCRIVICGDICVMHDTVDLFESGNVSELFKGLMTPFKEADLLVGNLEFPITDNHREQRKSNRFLDPKKYLEGKKSCVDIFKNAGFDLLGVANNHVRDCGDEGVFSTLTAIHDAGIRTVGAGENAIAARQPELIEVEGWKIGFMAFAEHEFNAALESRPGANLFDPYESLDEIRAFRKKCDYLILLYHGGIEHYAYPSPMLQKKCRKMIDCGADLVLCQHSHCIGTSESFGGGTIVYGQGNTTFGYRENSPDWNEGLIVSVALIEDLQKKAVVEYIPIRAEHSGINLMPENEAESLLQTFLQRSQKIGNSAFIAESWERFCDKKKSHYLPMLLGHGRIINYANRKLKNRIIKLLYSKTKLRNLLNLVRCEAHYEVAQTILKRSSDTE